MRRRRARDNAQVCSVHAAFAHTDAMNLESYCEDWVKRREEVAPGDFQERARRRSMQKPR
jgi:predicted alpha/beta-hydrolase family hydrolase